MVITLAITSAVVIDGVEVKIDKYISELVAFLNSKGIKTHSTVQNALKIVENLEHRAGKDAEGKTGDGVGILLQISHDFFKRECNKLGFDIGEEREYGIAQLFFPQNELKRNQAKKMFEIIVQKEGLEFLGWRVVPTVPSVLGHKAVECMPCIMQAFVKKPANIAKGLDFYSPLVYNSKAIKHMESCPSWSKEHDWKSCKSLKRLRGFESLALRQI